MSIQANQFKKLNYYSPYDHLPGLHNSRRRPEAGDEEKVSKKEATRVDEAYQGLLFCRGMSERYRKHFYFSPYEDSDFDGVMYWAEGNIACFAKIQLKEVPHPKLNETASLQGQLDDLARLYPRSPDLHVAIILNRTSNIDLAQLRIPKIQLRGLYVCMAVAEHQRSWMLAGDLLSGIEYSYFTIS